MHDGMQYDPIQGQGHQPLKVGNSTIFEGYLLPIYKGGGWQMTTYSYIMCTIPKACQGRIFDFYASFCVTRL